LASAGYLSILFVLSVGVVEDDHASEDYLPVLKVLRVHTVIPVWQHLDKAQR